MGPVPMWHALRAVYRLATSCSYTHRARACVEAVSQEQRIGMWEGATGLGQPGKNGADHATQPRHSARAPTLEAMPKLRKMAANWLLLTSIIRHWLPALPKLRKMAAKRPKNRSRPRIGQGL